ncbi:hypothetical protein [Roseateles sp.]|uniref:hypothetical protein n=1 Tax=Roseateles sp. TaxID=1971397 RepID=UPI0039E8ECD2
MICAARRANRAKFQSTLPSIVAHARPGRQGTLLQALDTNQRQAHCEGFNLGRVVASSAATPDVHHGLVPALVANYADRLAVTIIEPDEAVGVVMSAGARAGRFNAAPCNAPSARRRRAIRGSQR